LRLRCHRERDCARNEQARCFCPTHGMRPRFQLMIRSTVRGRRVLLDARGPVVSGSPTLFNRFRRLVNEKHPIAGPQPDSMGHRLGAERRILKIQARRSRGRRISVTTPERGGCPFGNPRGVGKADERSTRGWFLDQTWCSPGARALDRRTTNMWKSSDDAVRGARSPLVPIIWRVVGLAP
jgi:hypothetical protein